MAEITLRKGLEVCYTQCQREYNARGSTTKKGYPQWIAFFVLCSLWGIILWALCACKGDFYLLLHTFFKRFSSLK